MSRARDLSRLSSPTNFTADGTTNRVGLGSENPTAKLNVAGIVSATAFYGDGSNLDGVASAGLGTAISETAPGDVIYYTDTTLGINADITIDHPSSANVSYTQYQEIAVADGIDFIVSDGDEFIPDVLGLSTVGVTPLVGAGGRIRADLFTNKAGTGAPTFQTGVVITGVATATTFSGALSGNATSATSAQGLTGTPDIAVRNITGVAATFTGVLTYEDVTNVDSVGVITARSDVSIADKIIHTGDTNTAIRFPAADTFTVETAGSEALRVDSSGRLLKSGQATLTSTSLNHPIQVTASSESNAIAIIGKAADDIGELSYYEADKSTKLGEIQYRQDHANIRHRVGDIRFATGGVTERLRITSTGTAIFKSGLAEKYENAGTTLGSQPNNPLSDGNVILFTGNESGNKTINFTGVHSTLSNGETVSFTAIITPNNSGKITVVQVDGQAITIKWSGGSAPSAGSSGQDIYTFQILKTGTGVSDYTVFGAATNYA
tara:strand:+ start:1205 stop:2683 length:1479 start_codon:yes stop_codon:yes gene_type:complete